MTFLGEHQKPLGIFTLALQSADPCFDNGKRCGAADKILGQRVEPPL
jgi:hypothetical protein